MNLSPFNNRLNQDAFQITNDFNLYKKNHSFTFGASYESFKFGNSFNLTGYGPLFFLMPIFKHLKTVFRSAGAYVFGAYPLDVDVATAKSAAAADQWSWYYLTVGQLSAYAQDEWQVNDKFRLTIGLRVDMPVYMEDKISNSYRQVALPVLPLCKTMIRWSYLIKMETLLPMERERILTIPNCLPSHH